MNVWAISDLHLCFSTPDKSMEIFGKEWMNYPEKIKTAWEKNIHPEDLVLISGDISWAMHFQDALADLQWIDSLPGTKIILKGNHDYWWSSVNKMQKEMPSSLHILHNNSLYFHEIAIGGTRLWDDPSIPLKETTALKTEEQREQDQKIFQRELMRLERSLSSLNPQAKIRIAMTHFPPIGSEMQSTPVTNLLEKFQVNICVFGHLHALQKKAPLLGEKNGIQYYLTSADYLDFIPIKII
ncbi:MAG: metallophosphoesterase [Parachlamydiales bacterium]|nr:metallophosphoesterase [Parachlamydiales bacterium]